MQKYNSLLEIYYSQKADELKSHTINTHKYEPILREYVNNNHVGKYYRTTPDLSVIFGGNANEGVNYIYVKECTEELVGLEILICYFTRAGVDKNIPYKLNICWVGIDEYIHLTRDCDEITANEFIIGYNQFQSMCNDFLFESGV